MEVCADVIASYQGKLVLVDRLSEPFGLALPGGRLEEGESLEDCARREFREETGLELLALEQIRTYSDPSRDPRGHKVSTVYAGEAYGSIKDEDGKTLVGLYDPGDLQRKEMAFDHYDILQDYMKSYGVKLPS